MRKKITVRILLAGILAALLAGTAKAEPYTFTDDLGREITVDAPTKVIPTIGSYTKIWMLAGGTDSIVAASNDSWEEFHLELPESTVNLGKTKELNLELLAAQEVHIDVVSLERPFLRADLGSLAAHLLQKSDEIADICDVGDVVDDDFFLCEQHRAQHLQRFVLRPLGSDHAVQGMSAFDFKRCHC